MKPPLPVYAAGEHAPTHVRLGSSSFLAGCGCGWTGEPRTSLAGVLYDCLKHCEPYVPHVEMCTDPSCPIDARR
jgi:hypothetical protein